jgi:hypothetical protein
MYLFEDAAKYHREEIFGSELNTLSEIFAKYDEIINRASNINIDIIRSLKSGQPIEENDGTS